MVISSYGAILGLTLSIILIIKKFSPAYSLIFGALIGGILGGATLEQTINFMMTGSTKMIPAVIRVITSGVLAGVLIETGAAYKIALTIVDVFGKRKAILALILSAFILTSIGVIVDISIITIAPVALAIAKEANLSKMSILLAMSGGAKAGNIISPNPNSIAVSQSFNIPLEKLMFAGLIPAIFGIIITYLFAKFLIKKGQKINVCDIYENTMELPSFFSSIIGPLVAILLLSLKVIAKIEIDPLIALPVGGLIGCIATKNSKNFGKYCSIGLTKMSGVALILICTGTFAGIIANSDIKILMIDFLRFINAKAFLLAPLSGIIMSCATASTVSGAAVAANVFGPTIIDLNINPLNGGAMLHVGSTVGDHLPQGSLFHSSAAAVNIDMKERFKLILFETLIALSMTTVSILIYGI